MLSLYWILFFLIYFLDYEKIDVRIQILKPHKLNPPPPKRRSDVFRSKIDLRVAPYTKNYPGRRTQKSVKHLR